MINVSCAFFCIHEKDSIVEAHDVIAFGLSHSGATKKEIHGSEEMFSLNKRCFPHVKFA